MFKWIERKLKKLAITRSLKKNAPDRFSYSAETDYYTAVVSSPDRSRQILVDALDEEFLTGRQWDGERYSTQIRLPLGDIDKLNLEINRFYGYNRIACSGVLDFWRSELTLLPFRMNLKEAITQKIFNRRLRFRQDRIEVLKRLVDIHILEAGENLGLLHQPRSKGVVQLFSDFYGDRVFVHPNYEQESARFRLIIDSLSATGELSKTNLHEYTLNPLAVASISQYELDERRHSDSVKQNRRLVWITIVTTIAAVFQAIAAFTR